MKMSLHGNFGRWAAMAMLAVLLGGAGVVSQSEAAEAHTLTTGPKSCAPDETVRISAYVYSVNSTGVSYLRTGGTTVWTEGRSWSPLNGYYTVYFDTGVRSIANGKFSTFNPGEIISVGASCI